MPSLKVSFSHHVSLYKWTQICIDFLWVDMTLGEARMLPQKLFQPIMLNYSWLGVVCTDCLLPATRLQMKVTAMLLLCQVLHALCHCTQCSSDMGIFLQIHISIIFVCLFAWSGVQFKILENPLIWKINLRNLLLNLAGALLLSNVLKIIFSILFTT